MHNKPTHYLHQNIQYLTHSANSILTEEAPWKSPDNLILMPIFQNGFFKIKIMPVAYFSFLSSCIKNSLSPKYILSIYKHFF